MHLPCGRCGRAHRTAAPAPCRQCRKPASAPASSAGSRSDRPPAHARSAARADRSAPENDRAPAPSRPYSARRASRAAGRTGGRSPLRAMRSARPIAPAAQRGRAARPGPSSIRAPSAHPECSRSRHSSPVRRTRRRPAEKGRILSTPERPPAPCRPRPPPARQAACARPAHGADRAFRQNRPGCPHGAGRSRAPDDRSPGRRRPRQYRASARRPPSFAEFHPPQRGTPSRYPARTEGRRPEAPGRPLPCRTARAAEAKKPHPLPGIPGAVLPRPPAGPLSAGCGSYPAQHRKFAHRPPGCRSSAQRSPLPHPREAVSGSPAPRRSGR